MAAQLKERKYVSQMFKNMHEESDTYHIPDMHDDGVQSIPTALVGRALLGLPALLTKSKVLLFGCEERRKVEVLREGHVILEFLETARERHRIRIGLGDLLEALEVDDKNRWRDRDEVALEGLAHDYLLRLGYFAVWGALTG